MKLTVLGCYGTFPGMNGACSGYLLQCDGINIVLDCGNGTIGRLQRYIRIEDIDVIILSHLHLDHTADAFILKYALETKMEKGQKTGRKKLLCPSGPAELAGELFDGSVFDVVAIKENMEFKMGNFSLSFMEMKHLIESYAVILKCREGKFVYSGDTGSCEKLVKASKNADLLLCESTILKMEADIRNNHHLSAGEAGRIAAEAKVRKLLLTHFWYEEDKHEYLNEARRYFDNVNIAEELSTYSL